MVNGLRNGSTTAVFLGANSPNLNEYFKTASFWDSKCLFNPKVLVDEKYHKSKILKPEEDVDRDGNKGYFMMKDSF